MAVTLCWVLLGCPKDLAHLAALNRPIVIVFNGNGGNRGGRAGLGNGLAEAAYRLVAEMLGKHDQR